MCNGTTGSQSNSVTKGTHLSLTGSELTAVITTEISYRTFEALYLFELMQNLPQS